MAFVDEISLFMRAGRGGDGVVRFRHEKHRPKGGPSGGNGGKGGDIIVRGVRNQHGLAHFRHVHLIEGERGEDGGDNCRTGKAGANKIIEFPLGTVFYNPTLMRTDELLRDGQEIVLLNGGQGGLGNDYFKSSTNQTPKQKTNGGEGEEADFKIELKMIADIGLVGLPNAGKTSLLNALCGTEKKIGDYPFTTLEPNLGVYYGHVMADIPGLIEGASLGKGLGDRFLRHLERTKFFLHLISSAEEDVCLAYKTIRQELKKANQDLSQKPEIIVLTQADRVSEEVLKEKLVNLEKCAGQSKIETVSVFDDLLLERFKGFLSRTLLSFQAKAP